MKRRLHDFLHSFKKDSGAHFTYNLGVSLMRAGAVSMLIGLLILLAAIIFPPSRLKLVGEVPAAIKNMYVDRKYTTPTEVILRLMGFKSRDDLYIAEFEFELDGEMMSARERITKESYQRLSQLEPLGHFKLKLYKRANGWYYLSYHDKYLAERELHKADPELSYVQFSAVAFIISLLLWLVGRREESLAMKYPRSDVPFEQHALVPSDATNEDPVEVGFESAEPVQFTLEEKAGAAHEQTDT